jgi:DNA-binding transcriptional ArsR family regulator
MNVRRETGDAAVAAIAAAIGEPARVRMLYSLADGRARTSTELATAAEITPSTASVHLQRLKAQQLVTMTAQGKHRYYSLGGVHVADALEALSVLAGGTRALFVPNTPHHLRAARTCYDHLAGALGVGLLDRFTALGWIRPASEDAASLEVTTPGSRAFEALGLHLDAARAQRRRFAFACVDWSERRPHVGGALGAALLATVLRRRWVTRDLDSRALTITAAGRRELRARFGLQTA